MVKSSDKIEKIVQEVAKENVNPLKKGQKVIEFKAEVVPKGGAKNLKEEALPNLSKNPT